MSRNILLILLACFLCTEAIAAISPGRYTISSRHSGLPLHVDNTVSAAGANVIQMTANGATNQQFDVADLGNGNYSIRPVHSGMSLDVWAWSSDPGGEIRQWNYLGNVNQQWQVNNLGNGYYSIISAYNGLSLDVWEWSTASGGDIRQWTYAGGVNQQWAFTTVSSGGNGGTPPASNSLVGFAGQSGSDGYSTTTGGGNASPTIVTTCSALNNALNSSSTAVVQIPNNTTIDCRTSNRTVAACRINCPSYLDDTSKLFYRVPVSGQSCTELGANSNYTVNRTRNDTLIYVKSNKTLEGLGASSKVIGANFYLQNVQNVIIRNLAIENVNPALIEAGDGITLRNTSHIWLDHLSFKLISDGHIDMYDSSNVTMSWNRFDGTNPDVCGGEHHYTQLVQDSQVTLHHNAYLNVYGRNPKIGGSASRAHLFNNFYKNIDYFAIGVGEYGQALVENNYFENAAKPHWDSGNGFIQARGNEYRGISSSDPDRDSNANVFGDVNMYSYSLDSGVSVPNLVNDNAGPR